MLNLKIDCKKSPYEFDLDANGLPALTKKNFEFVKVLIENDSNYRAPNDKSKNYKLILQEGFPKTYEEILLVVKLIDKYDSTRLSSEGRCFGNFKNGREITAKKIEDLLNNCDLEGQLRKGCSEPVHLIANAVNEEHIKTLGIDKGRYNISFATKFCAYSSLYAFNKDNYCIYDSVLSNILPYYAKMYCNENISNISIKTLEDYKKYKSIIDNIICSAEKMTSYKSSYKEFDDLLWYYFKGENSRIKEAKKCLKGK